MNNRLAGMGDAQVENLIAALYSLVDGELAITMLIAQGDRAVPHLEHFLLAGPPRTIALPRCRAAHALGELGAYSTLISYFRQYELPCDAEVLFAEDAVRSAVARALIRWKCEEVFHVLLDAARQRATSGLIFSLGEFHRSESIPLLFEVLEDDFCREEAKDGLRKVSETARQYAILSIRGLTDTRLHVPSALRQLRATLQLLGEFGVLPEEWCDLRNFLLERDADVVIATANIGSAIGPKDDRPQILQALFRISDHLNWMQEDQVTTILDSHPELAREIARTMANERRAGGEHPNWLVPFWRILKHLLGAELERDHYATS